MNNEGKAGGKGWRKRKREKRERQDMHGERVLAAQERLRWMEAPLSFPQRRDAV